MSESQAANGSAERRGIKPWLEYQLCRDLATGEKTRAALAREHGVARSTMTEFAQRHAARIAEIKSNLDDEFAGLWVADKKNRIAAYQRDLEMIAANGHHEWVKARTAILRQVADELGQMPARGISVSGQVTHVLEGVEIEDLK